MARRVSTDLCKIHLHLDGGADADCGSHMQFVDVLLDIGQTHAGAEAHVTDLGRGGGVAFLHGPVDVGDTRASVYDLQGDLVGLDVGIDGATVSVCDGVDLGLL